jgi:hypothetical protein
MSLHLFFSNMKFQTNLLTDSDTCRTVFVAVARKLGNPPRPQVHIFGTKIDKFPNEILNVFTPNFEDIKFQAIFKIQEKFHCIKSIIFCVIYL